MQQVLQYALYLLILVLLAIPLGRYISKVMQGERVFLSKVLSPCECRWYRLLRIDSSEDMNWKQYAAGVVSFSVLSLLLLFLILKFQNLLPLNPQQADGLSWHLAFNTAVSFVTNTNWQTYSGEVTLSNFSQAAGLTVQNFVSAAVGISVLFALIRGLCPDKVQVHRKLLGGFDTDGAVHSTAVVPSNVCSPDWAGRASKPGR